MTATRAGFDKAQSVVCGTVKGGRFLAIQVIVSVARQRLGQRVMTR